MKIVVLALDHRSAAHSVRGAVERISGNVELVPVVSESIGHAAEVVVPGARKAEYPSERMDPLARVRRVLAMNRMSRRVWAAVRESPEVRNILRPNDLLVAGDEVSVRSAWELNRRLGIRAIARTSGIPFALKQSRASAGRA